MARKYRAFQIAIEPLSAKDVTLLTEFGYKLNRYPSLPSKTILIDLLKDDKELMGEMHSKTRYNIGKAKRNKLTVYRSENISEFAQLWQVNSKHWGMFLPQRHEITSLFYAFGNNADIFFAKDNENIIAGVMTLCTKDTIHYMYAFSTQGGNRLFAPTLLVWEILSYAKIKRLKIFDFGGIYDERFPLPSWKGFSRFKQNFGGRVIEYPGVYVKSFLPLGITF